MKRSWNSSTTSGPNVPPTSASCSSSSSFSEALRILVGDAELKKHFARLRRFAAPRTHIGIEVDVRKRLNEFWVQVPTSDRPSCLPKLLAHFCPSNRALDQARLVFLMFGPLKSITCDRARFAWWEGMGAPLEGDVGDAFKGLAEAASILLGHDFPKEDHAHQILLKIFRCNISQVKRQASWHPQNKASLLLLLPSKQLGIRFLEVYSLEKEGSPDVAEVLLHMMLQAKELNLELEEVFSMVRHVVCRVRDELDKNELIEGIWTAFGEQLRTGQKKRKRLVLDVMAQYGFSLMETAYKVGKKSPDVQKVGNENGEEEEEMEE